MDARGIIERLRHRHRLPSWVFVAEARVGTGYGRDADPRLDAWAMNCWPSAGLERIAYEVKVSRGDFLRELRQPSKRRHALRFSNRFLFAAPKGVILPSELPPEAGLVEVDQEGGLQTVVEAPFRESLPPTWRFMASLMRTLAEQDRQVLSRAAYLVGKLVQTVEHLQRIVEARALSALREDEREKFARLVEDAGRFLTEVNAGLLGGR